MDNPVINFGRFKGLTINQAPDDYIRWMISAADNPKPGETRSFPPDVLEAARRRYAEILARDEIDREARRLLSGAEDPQRPTRYVIERQGDIDGHTVHGSLDEALQHLASEYPLQEAPDDDDRTVGICARTTPDPEDDRILIWEVLPSGHRKVVWQFAGWHYSADEYACGQGALPGDEETLYDLAMREM